MGAIVFSTIAENIRSFFAREEELTAKPKQLPDAASDIYERPGARTQPLQPPQTPIVDKPLPQGPPVLPFSPDELRQALKAPKPEPKPERVERRDVTHEISHEIAAFESALQHAHETVKPEPPKYERREAPAKTHATAQPAGPGFFDEFEHFLAHEDVDVQDLLERDVLWRMKEYHKNRLEGKEYYVRSKDIQAAIKRRVNELKVLEHEWFSRRGDADRIEGELVGIEREIETRTADLKTLLQQAKSKSRLEREAPLGQEFQLADGRRLSSLLDLKTGLPSMPDSVFYSHVTPLRHDFASWVRGSFGEEQLAREMEKIRDKEQLAAFLARLN